MRATARLDPAFIEALQQLVTHEQFSVDLCELAGQSHLRSGLRPSHAPVRLDRLRDDYRRHLKSLQLLLESLGIEYELEPSPLAFGCELTVSTPAMLNALYLSSLYARARYHGILARQDLPVPVRGVLAGNLANILYHSAWLKRAVRTWRSDLRGNQLSMRVSGVR
jgi:hypothetical protein